MKEKELLDSLRDKINDEKLPFDESGWQDLRLMLDDKKRRNVLPLTPIKWKYIVGGMAAAALLFVLVNYRDQNEAKHNKIVKEQQKEPAIQNDKPSSPDFEKHTQIATQIDISNINPARTSSQVTTHKSLFDTGNTTNEEIIALTKNEESILDTGSATNTQIVLKSENKTQTQPKEAPQEDQVDWNEVPRTKYQPVFLSGGGINYQSQSLGYAVKIGLDKPVSSRFSVNAELAVNTNSRNFSTYEATIKQQPIMGNAGAYNFYDTAYTRTDQEFAQTFAQALVGFNYKLYSKGKAGMGVDAFRIIKSRKDVEEFNSFMSDNKTTTLWNVGLRLQYTQYLNRHFDLGASYRQDISSAINKNWQNNFLQLMIVYKLNEKK